ncbi:GNAT family N-acetyltransferase [Lacticaseibacillus parakribbianus]|uniref:GNAT family N-acetyltransferase n=1 Tax=Lacticaseibacillus parakribbianus TaxID=2970927 RepID=UPI0021CB7745|nr:GNAT family N-acetyltransferase [Lacticaseibacillus parakribbianus]
MDPIRYEKLADHTEAGRKYFIEHWLSDTLIVSAGDYHFDDLNGLIALEGETVVGLITYAVHGNAMAIVSLNSVRNGRGVGKHLLHMAENRAKMLGLTVMDVSVMNDNLQALGFFQRQGYRLNKILRGSVDIARQRKPEIPSLGSNDIPLHDEVLMAKRLVLPRTEAPAQPEN